MRVEPVEVAIEVDPTEDTSIPYSWRLARRARGVKRFRYVGHAEVVNYNRDGSIEAQVRISKLTG